MSLLVKVYRVLGLAVVLLCSMPAFAQPQQMTIGIKGGAQLNTSFYFDQGAGVETNYVRPILGVTFEKPLSPTISIEADALYNPEKFRYPPYCVAPQPTCSSGIEWETHGHTLEFPVILKKYWGTSLRDRYFANAGISVRRMTMSTWTNVSCAPSPAPGSFCSYVLQDTHGSFGFVFGGGVDFSRKDFHFYPELRYTRWLSNEWTGNVNILQPNQNALSMLIGFSFGK